MHVYWEIAIAGISALACVANILITLLWETRLKSVLGKMVLCLSAVDLIWAVLYMIFENDYYRKKMSDAGNYELIIEEQTYYCILYYCVGCSMVWSTCFGQVGYQMAKRGDGSIRSVLWKCLLISHLGGLTLSISYFTLSEHDPVRAPNISYLILTLICVAFSCYKYCQLLKLPGRRKRHFLLYPAITIVCNLPLSLSRAIPYTGIFSFGVINVFQDIFTTIWMLEGFFNSFAYGILSAIIHYCQKKPQGKEEEEEDLGTEDESIFDGSQNSSYSLFKLRAFTA